MSLVGSALEEFCFQSKSRFIHDENEVKLMAGTLQSCKDSVGLPPDLGIKFVAPSLRGTLALITEEVLRLDTMHNPVENIDAFKTLVKNGLVSLKSHTSNNQTQVLKLVKLFLSKVTGLATDIKSLEARAVDVSKPSGGSDMDDILGMLGKPTIDSPTLSSLSRSLSRMLDS